MGYSLSFFTTPVLWSLPAAGLAILFGTWVAIRADTWLAPAGAIPRRVRTFVRLHLLEPWITIPWILVLAQSGLPFLAGTHLTVVSLVFTAPMALLLVPWLPVRAEAGARQLVQLLRIYGVCRWCITGAMWATLSTVGIQIALFGTVFLWVNVVHLRLALGALRIERPLHAGAP